MLIATILLVQFVAFGGALLFGRLRQPVGAKATILAGLVVWMVIVVGGVRAAAQAARARSWRSASLIGLVLGGTQALSRSFFSQLIPRGREAEYFSLYQAVRARHELAGHAGLRPGAPVDRLLPARDLRADGLLRGRDRAAVAGRRTPRDRRSRQPGASVL